MHQDEDEEAESEEESSEAESSDTSSSSSDEELIERAGLPAKQTDQRVDVGLEVKKAHVRGCRLQGIRRPTLPKNNALEDGTVMRSEKPSVC